MTKIDAATIWLKQYLTVHGKSNSHELMYPAAKAGHQPWNVYKAFKRLEGVITNQGSSYGTYWELPNG
jgi:hypothetical protein